MATRLVDGFNAVYAEYYPKSYAFVKSYVHDAMATEDIVSDTLVRLWERMGIETIDPIAPFLFTMLKNKCLDYLKHQSIRQDVHQDLKCTLERELQVRILSLESTDPLEIFSHEIQHIVDETLQALPSKTRDVFVMSRYGNKPHKEIAEKQGISVKGVDYHISLSVKALRSALKDYLL
ncbi:MAG: RNA polymerase sigma-70 factor [Breznakibacter sp.]